ncbi:hypothetical protein C723_0956 [Christiangramia flava JLT2011]|nr:hypothetical protein C723_0956 [Christiangramia flava JLT2011]
MVISEGNPTTFKQTDRFLLNTEQLERSRKSNKIFTHLFIQ